LQLRDNISFKHLNGWRRLYLAGKTGRAEAGDEVAAGWGMTATCREVSKVLWYDGDGLCLFAKRLERGTLRVATGHEISAPSGHNL